MPQPKRKPKKTVKRPMSKKITDMTLQDIAEQGGSIKFVPRPVAADSDGMSMEHGRRFKGMKSWIEENRILPSPGEAEPKKTFASGATRSGHLGERYDLMSPEANRRRALVYGHGARTHGERNWENGMPVSECLNRAIRHLNLYQSGDLSEDHLAHAAVNLDFVMHFERHNPECLDSPSHKPALTERTDR